MSSIRTALASAVFTESPKPASTERLRSHTQQVLSRAEQAGIVLDVDDLPHWVNLGALSATQFEAVVSPSGWPARQSTLPPCHPHLLHAMVFETPEDLLSPADASQRQWLAGRISEFRARLPQLSRLDAPIAVSSEASVLRIASTDKRITLWAVRSAGEQHLYLETHDVTGKPQGAFHVHSQEDFWGV